MKTPNSVRATLRAARRLISNRKNWIKHEYHDDGKFCAVGALNFVDGPFEHKAKRKLIEALPTSYEGTFIEGYNDRPDTRHRDILALFDRAIRG